MILEDKSAVIYGGGGAIGGAVARAFADAGARVYLAGRTMSRLEKVAGDIGDVAGVAQVDAFDERAVAKHADAVAKDAGRIDIALNAVSLGFVHFRPFSDVGIDDVMRPIDGYLRTNLITIKAVARHMSAQRSGTIVLLSSGASQIVPGGALGYGTACVAIETITQRLAVELGPNGIRIACLRPHLIADAASNGSLPSSMFEEKAAAVGLTVEEFLQQSAEHVTLLGRLPTLAQVADAAVFLASDRAGATTGAVFDLTSGNAVRNAASALVGVIHS
jgi:NAD(P)-dependent dehydrogenase (short-subunit alcohol dehydrogenase family)